MQLLLISRPWQIFIRKKIIFNTTFGLKHFFSTIFKCELHKAPNQIIFGALISTMKIVEIITKPSWEKKKYWNTSKIVIHRKKIFGNRLQLICPCAHNGLKKIYDCNQNVWCNSCVFIFSVWCINCFMFVFGIGNFLNAFNNLFVKNRSLVRSVPQFCAAPTYHAYLPRVGYPW